MSVSPPNAPPRQSRRQGQRIKRPLAVYNLCLELDDGKTLVVISVFPADGLCVLSSVGVFMSCFICICVCMHMHARLIVLEHVKKQGELQWKESIESTVLWHMFKSMKCLKYGFFPLKKKQLLFLWGNLFDLYWRLHSHKINGERTKIKANLLWEELMHSTVKFIWIKGSGQHCTREYYYFTWIFNTFM